MPLNNCVDESEVSSSFPVGDGSSCTVDVVKDECGKASTWLLRFGTYLSQVARGVSH